MPATIIRKCILQTLFYLKVEKCLQTVTYVTENGPTLQYQQILVRGVGRSSRSRSTRSSNRNQKSSIRQVGHYYQVVPLLNHYHQGYCPDPTLFFIYCYCILNMEQVTQAKNGNFSAKIGNFSSKFGPQPHTWTVEQTESPVRHLV